MGKNIVYAVMVIAASILIATATGSKIILEIVLGIVGLGIVLGIFVCAVVFVLSIRDK